MLKITLKTTPNLQIGRVFNTLTQGAIYEHLPNIEHEGFRLNDKKIFKSFCYLALYHSKSGDAEIYFGSINKEYEQTLAKAVLFDSFKIGEIIFFSKQVELIEPKIEPDAMTVRGNVVAKVKDAFGKHLFLEPRDSRFLEQIKRNALDKFEALHGFKYDGELEISLLNQYKEPLFIRYKEGSFKSYTAAYKISAKKEMLALLLNTGMGEKTAQGCGFLRVLEAKPKEDERAESQAL